MKINWGKLSLKELAGLVSEHLKENGIDAVLVGGACVAIYSEGLYVSKDLDFVTDAKIRDLEIELAKIGFHKVDIKLFTRQDSEFILDFIPAPAALGNEPVQQIGSLATRSGEIRILTPSDCVKDRLAAYFHWNDYPSLEQALMVAKAQKVNLSEIKRWSEAEGKLDKYKEFESKFKKFRRE